MSDRNGKKADAFLLGVDVGTTSAKAVLFTASGQEVAAVEQGYPLRTPQPGWVEQDPEIVWQAVAAVLRNVSEALPAGREIAAMALSAQCGSFVPVATDGTPIHRFVTWMDRRTDDLVARWRAAGHDESVRALSGWLLHPGLPLPGIAWLQEQRPEIFAETARFLAVNDYIIFRLTGQFVTDPSCASEMLLVDRESGAWSDALCALAGIGSDQLSQIRPSAAPIGHLTDRASAETGLASTVLVVNGGHDHACEAAATGMTGAGKLLLTCGTAWVITGVVESPDLSAIPGHMDLNPHVVPERWTVSQFLGSFGAALDWWLRETSQGRAKYDYVDEALHATMPGAKGLFFLPPGATSPPARWGGQLVGLRLDHGRSEMARALLEGAAFEVRRALSQLRESGQPVEALWMVGGATRSNAWPQIVSDATGIPVHVTQYPHWSVLGAAILAGVGVGWFASVGEAPVGFTRPVVPVLPDEERTAHYERAFANYEARLSASERAQAQRRPIISGEDTP